jgi:hypothetical protein
MYPPSCEVILSLLFCSTVATKEVAMFRKITILALLIALVLSVLPTIGVFASSGTNKDLEKKWDQLVTNFNRQDQDHMKAHKWVDGWLVDHKNSSTKPEVERHLAACNSAILTAHAIVASHEGFNAKGKVINKNLAYRSIKDLSNALRAHAASVKSILEHVK